MKIDNRLFYQRYPGSFPNDRPEDALWEQLRDPRIRSFALELVGFIKEQLGDKKYAKIEGMREALRFIAYRFE